jgi:tRNA(Glu) U13 pseudouridine synthase TruD
MKCISFEGSDVQYPNNEFGEACYSELLNKDGIKLTDFDHHHKTYVCYGVYRKVISVPGKLKYSIQFYENDDDRFILSKDENKIVEELKSEKILSKRALILSFILPSSSYATMMIRELQHFPSL